MTAICKYFSLLRIDCWLRSTVGSCRSLKCHQRTYQQHKERGLIHSARRNRSCAKLQVWAEQTTCFVAFVSRHLSTGAHGPRSQQSVGSAGLRCTTYNATDNWQQSFPGNPGILQRCYRLLCLWQIDKFSCQCYKC